MIRVPLREGGLEGRGRGRGRFGRTGYASLPARDEGSESNAIDCNLKVGVLCSAARESATALPFLQEREGNQQHSPNTTIGAFPPNSAVMLAKLPPAIPAITLPPAVPPVTSTFLILGSETKALPVIMP